MNEYKTLKEIENEKKSYADRGFIQTERLRNEAVNWINKLEEEGKVAIAYEFRKFFNFRPSEILKEYRNYFDNKKEPKMIIKLNTEDNEKTIEKLKKVLGSEETPVFIGDKITIFIKNKDGYWEAK